MSILHLLSSCLAGWTSCLGLVDEFSWSWYPWLSLFQNQVAYLFPFALTLLPFYCSRKPVFFWYSSWCFLVLPSPTPVVGEADREVWGSGEDSGIQSRPWYATPGAPFTVSDGTRRGRNHPPFLEGKPPLGSGHQAQSCDLRREEGVNDENNWLGAGMKVQLLKSQKKRACERF